MNTLECWFRGLADINRLRILNLLMQGELCGCDIQHVLGSKQSNVSRHLAYLRNCGLLQHRRHGYRVYYQLAKSVSVDHKLLFDYLAHALGREETFGADRKRLKAAIKSGACTVSEWSPHDAAGNRTRLRMPQK
jgi:ArsR family transcriptional regulator